MSMSRATRWLTTEHYEMAVDPEMDYNNLSEDDIKKLMASGVDMSQMPDLQRKARDARLSKQDAFDLVASGAGGHAVNGLYLPNTAGYLVAGLRGLKANREERDADSQIKGVLDAAKEASGSFVNQGMLGRTGLPTEESSIDTVNQPDMSAAMAANPMGTPATAPTATGAPAAPSVQMAQAAALRKKKKAAMPGSTPVAFTGGGGSFRGAGASGDFGHGGASGSW